MTKERALGLAEIGLHVFPCRERETTINGVVYAVKSPYPADGFYSATTDADKITGWWDEHPAALVGVWAGASGLVVLDIDVKRDDNGRITVDGFDDLDSAWLNIPETFSYKSVNGEGAHKVYADPGNVDGLAPKTKYRGMRGIDRRSGGSYVVWAGEVPKSKDVFTPAPDWFLDASEVRSADAFKGDVKDWFNSLTPGEPNVLVRRAIDRVNTDMTHQDMVSAQYEAVRLGAEGNPGVPQLLSALEDAWLNRPADNHTTPEGQWEYKFAEALASGIKEYGGEIALVKDMPEYSLALVPSEVPDRLISGPPGDKATFNHLLREMTDRQSDDLKVLSVMWNVPTVRELSREWGLMFTMKRIQEARLKPPPVKENPSLEKTSSRPTDGLLTDDERQYAIDHPTFINDYVDASAAKGFVNEDYAVPAAWTMLSMAFGGRAFVPNGVKGLNLWFNILGYSGTGKAQPLTSKVLTPSGFKTMGEMAVGDFVVVPSGGTARVSGVYPQGARPVYLVEFQDGRVVEADENHLWTVRRSGVFYEGKRFVKTTKELLGDTHWSTGERKWFVETIQAPDLGAWNSTIDPYSLGLLLGDGGLTDVTTKITTVDDEILDHLRGAIPERLNIVRQGNSITYTVSGGNRFARNEWTVELERLGIMGHSAHTKSIPEECKNVSAEDRLALLQGIMDTDGSPSRNGNSGDYLSASEHLADDVAWLVRSLGGRATKSIKKVRMEGWDVPRTYHRLYVSLPPEMDLFRLTRKVERKNHQGKYNGKFHSIKSITFKGEEATQCIMVDHPDHEYVTDGFIRTHNTSENDFLRVCLDLMLKDGETYYNLGANSSPEAMHEALLERDRKASIVHHDEASDFFDNLKRKDWMTTLKDLMAKWYSGFVDPIQKVRLKENRGKSAVTSYNIHMFATPDRLLGLIDTSMFETGFLARFNWVWGSPPENEDRKYLVSRSKVDEEGVNPLAYELVADLLFALKGLPVTKPVAIDWTEMAMERLVEAHKEMDRQAKERDYYTATEPAVTRLGRDTIWKCAALLALYRGERVIRYQDAITAIYYAERWFHDLFRVVGAAGEGDFNRDANEIEAYIRSYPAGVTQASVYYRFRKMIDKSKRELDDRIDFLLASGRILRDSSSTDTIRYKTNGGGE